MKFMCWLFGHTYSRATTGMTAVNGQPVFRCRCGTEWITASGLGYVRPTKRDSFT